MTNYARKLLIEAIVVGLGLIVVGLSVSAAMKGSRKVDREAWYAMARALFVSGFLFHVLCEVAGVNAWYCNNSAACMASNQ